MHRQISELDNLLERFLKISNFINLIDLQKKEFKNNNLSKEFKECLENNINSKVNYNAIIISIYSAFESFIDSIANNYCKFIFENINSFEDIPKPIRDFYFINIGDFLKSPHRYNINSTSQSIILKAGDLIKNVSIDDLTYKFIIKHSGNLKMVKVDEFFKNIGIKNIINNIKENPLFEEIFLNTEGYNIKDVPDNFKIFNTLDTLVEQRNSIAHSWDIKGNRYSNDIILSEKMPFIQTICECLLECTLLESYKFVYELGNGLINLGQASKIWDNNILGFENININITNNTYIFCKCGKNKENLLFIQEIRVNDKTVDIIDGENNNVTIKFNKKIKKNWEFFYYPYK